MKQRTENDDNEEDHAVDDEEDEDELIEAMGLVVGVDREDDCWGRLDDEDEDDGMDELDG